MIVEGATYNSFADATFARCLQGTRTDIYSESKIGLTIRMGDVSSGCVVWLGQANQPSREL